MITLDILFQWEKNGYLYTWYMTRVWYITEPTLVNAYPYAKVLF